jgi:hypothetical protein
VRANPSRNVGHCRRTDKRPAEFETQYKEDFFHNHLITVSPSETSRAEVQQSEQLYPRLSFAFFAYEKRQALLDLRRDRKDLIHKFFGFLTGYRGNNEPGFFRLRQQLWVFQRLRQALT